MSQTLENQLRGLGIHPDGIKFYLELTKVSKSYTFKAFPSKGLWIVCFYSDWHVPYKFTSHSTEEEAITMAITLRMLCK